MKIRWTQPTQSGLGDRLTDIFMLAIYARVRQAEMHIDWPPFPAKAIDVEHRRTDILLENVLKFMAFPQEIVFDRSAPVQETFDHYLGAGFQPEEFYAAYLKNFCSLDRFNEVKTTVAKDFIFCAPISAFMRTLPAKFVSVHIRRGDKVRPGANDGCFISEHELGLLNELTYRAIDHFAKSFDAFFVCGDQAEKVQPFVEYVEKLPGKTLLKTPPMPKWEATYYDLATMTKSQWNLASQRFSSFSRFPALIGAGAFATPFGMRDQGLI